jgi:tetratricopeptide (TPR) repeat protein
MEENADTLCKSYLDKSIEYEPKNSETLQLLASYWLSKEDMDQAKKYILESLDSWLPKYLEACEAGPLVDPAQAITLTYDSRINTSKILTEVQEYDKAITVLEQLIEEDDEVVVVS